MRVKASYLITLSKLEFSAIKPALYAAVISRKAGYLNARILIASLRDGFHLTHAQVEQLREFIIRYETERTGSGNIDDFGITAAHVILGLEKILGITR